MLYFYLRRIVAICFGVFMLLGFLGYFYPISFFDLQIAPLVQRVIIYPSITALVLLTFLILITLLFGQIYCSTLCPLGLLQELLLWLYKPIFHRMKKKRGNFYQKHYAIHYLIAVIAFGLLMGGSAVIIRYIDPYSVSGNLSSLAVYGITFFVLLAILTFIKKRFFCTNICPVGAILGFLSRFALFKIKFAESGCVKCGMCARGCPSNSIDYQNQVINNETCVKCLRCLAPCPKGHIIRQKAAPKPQPDFSPTRRKLLIGAVVLGALAGAYKSGLKISQDIAKKVKRVIVPAGAKNYHDFANRCLNCNLCVNNCPMKIIKKADNEYPVVHLDYGKNFCKYDCNKCARVCPSGAIEHISLKQKQNTQIAMAVIDEEKCIECGLCVHTCPKGIIAKQEGEKPIIDASECIGCGACHSACPVEAITIYPVEQHRNL